MYTGLHNKHHVQRYQTRSQVSNSRGHKCLIPRSILSYPIILTYIMMAKQFLNIKYNVTEDLLFYFWNVVEQRIRL